MYLTTISRPPSRWDLYSGRGEGGGPSLPLEHSLVLHKTVSANFKVSQLEHSCARERQVTYLARLKLHLSLPPSNKNRLQPTPSRSSHSNTIVLRCLCLTTYNRCRRQRYNTLGHHSKVAPTYIGYMSLLQLLYCCPLRHYSQRLLQSLLCRGNGRGVYSDIHRGNGGHPRSRYDIRRLVRRVDGTLLRLARARLRQVISSLFYPPNT